MKKKREADKYRDRHLMLPPDIDDAILARADAEDRDYAYIARRLLREGLKAEKAA